MNLPFSQVGFSGQMTFSNALMDWKPAFRKLLNRLVWSWGALLLHRLVFIVINRPEQSPHGGMEILQVFLTGLRFDIISLPIMLWPILLFLPLFKNPQALPAPLRVLARSLDFISYPWFVLCNGVLLASTLFFNSNNKHIGWEFYSYVNEYHTVIKSAFGEHPILVILVISLLPLSFVAAWIRMKSRTKNDQVIRPKTLLRKITEATLVQILALALGVIALRGGFQESPLRAADALHAGSPFLSGLALNGLFTVLQDRGEMSDFTLYYPEPENQKTVREILGARDHFVSNDYPLLRRMPPQPTFRKTKPNIVLVLLESFTAKYLAVHGGDPRIAPNMNRLIESGRYYTRFYSSGGRSANGLFCMLAGLPDRAGRTILRSSQIQNRFGGLAGILATKGYQSLFVHGGDLSFDNLRTVLPHLGFQTLVGRRELSASKRYQKTSVWGYHDEETFKEAIRLLKQPRQAPYFASIFSINTHHPYTRPNSHQDIFDSKTPQSEFLNSYNYADQVLGNFMKEARKLKDYENTIFLLVADHTHHTNLNYMEDRQIPFLIYAPGRIKPEKVDRVASQLDVLPTIFSLSGGDGLYASMGRDLNRPRTGPDFAFFAGGSGTNVIGWIEKDLLLSKWFALEQVYMFPSRPPLSVENLAPKQPLVRDRFLKKLLNYHQFARQLEKTNRIWPPAGSPLLTPEVKK